MDNKEPSTKKAILDALSEEILEENSIGKPEAPVMPLYGSENVQVSEEEEKLYT